MNALISSFILVFASEMGDKSQFMAMAFATFIKARTVLISILIAALLNMGIAVLFGSFITEYIPIKYVKLLAAISFLIFGLMTLKNGHMEHEKIRKSKYGPAFTIISTYFISEFGDKTQLSTLALTATYKSPIFVLLGATAGIFMADVIGIILGVYLGKKLPTKLLHYISAFIFIIFGFITLYEAKTL
ncbi:TMEM165/GDT1 family protein [Thermoanaerobacterium sp. CMT5567-10]|uniref:TMEM165/GDT1 family protein n=1 Tax=Thermoanaerobacterium sp. CMT5567-10 TaxID=3061989 RepID=UPI0026DF1A13|nr:TMEM165/GDT1 family protein [Thermoanaerobacterium sp. CMT5567-10]WKV09301.1 TMEM165/GDT1 family protein [Thermoanaerobacterium sp. CMT5567-10]